MLSTDDKQLHRKGCEKHDHIREKCKANNIYLIDNLNIRKPQHLNENRLHLKKNDSRILGGIFTRKVCKLLINKTIRTFQLF